MNISKFIKGIIGISALLISTCLWANNLTEQSSQTYADNGAINAVGNAASDTAGVAGDAAVDTTGVAGDAAGDAAGVAGDAATGATDAATDVIGDM